MREFLGIQYMRALTLIYSHRDLGFKQTQIEFDPIQKRNLDPKRKVKTRLSVDRPMSTVDCAVDRTQTESSLFSVGRPGGRPLIATVDREVDRANPAHVVHTGRLGGRRTFSTGRRGGRPEAYLAYFNALSCSFVF